MQLGAEAQGVLERVEALQHRQPAIAAGGSVALHESIAHPPNHEPGFRRGEVEWSDRAAA